MRLAHFAFVIAVIHGTLRAQDTAQLARAGARAVSAGAYTTGIYYLKQVVDAEAQHPSAWKDLCRAYLDLDQLSAAIDACNRQIEVNPKSAAAYGDLGLALWRKGRYEEAIAATQHQIELSPRDSNAHAELGHMYGEQEKYFEAITELEKAGASAKPDLGGAYLAASQTDKGLAMLNQLAHDHLDAATFSAVAYNLALHKVSLNQAQEYAQSAVTEAMSRLQTDSLNLTEIGKLRRNILLAECWDKLGFVYLQRGDLDRAEKLLSAAWALDPQGAVGDHLGRLYELRGQKKQAIQAYAWALAAPHALPAIERRLEALVPPGEIEGLVARAGEELTAMRTKSAGALLQDEATAVYSVIRLSNADVPLVQFIRGDGRLQVFTKTVGELIPANVIPDTAVPKLKRLAILTCPGQGRDCSMELLPASAAVIAELNAAPPETDFAKASVGEYRGGAGMTMPVPIYRPEPRYSKQALKKKYQGTVVLYIMVDKTGHPRNIKVIRSLGLGLDEKAVEAVGKWEFKPGTKDGEPVDVYASVEVNFRLMSR